MKGFQAMKRFFSFRTLILAITASLCFTQAPLKAEGLIWDLLDWGKVNLNAAWNNTENPDSFSGIGKTALLLTSFVALYHYSDSYAKTHKDDPNLKNNHPYLYRGAQILPLATQLAFLGCIGWGYYNIANNSNYVPWEFLGTTSIALAGFMWKIVQNIFEQLTPKEQPYASLNKRLQDAVSPSKLPEIESIQPKINKLKAIENDPDNAQSTLICAKPETGNLLLQSVAKAFYSNARLGNGYAIEFIDVKDYFQTTVLTEQAKYEHPFENKTIYGSAQTFHQINRSNTKDFAPKKLDTEKLLSTLTNAQEKLEQLGQGKSGGHYFLFLNRIDLLLNNTECILTDINAQQTILATLRQCLQNKSCIIIATSASEDKNNSAYLKEMFPTHIDLIGSAVDPEDRRLSLSEEEQKKRKEELNASERELMTPETRRALIKLLMPANTSDTDIESLVKTTRTLSLNDLIARAQVQKTLELNKPLNHPKPENKHEQDYRYFTKKDDSLAIHDAYTEAQVAKRRDIAIADSSFVAELPASNTNAKKQTAQEQELARLEREIKTIEEQLTEEQQNLKKRTDQTQEDAGHADSIFRATPQDFERSIKASQEQIAYLENELKQKQESLKKLSAEVAEKQSAQKQSITQEEQVKPLPPQALLQNVKAQKANFTQQMQQKQHDVSGTSEEYNKVVLATQKSLNAKKLKLQEELLREIRGNNQQNAPISQEELKAIEADPRWKAFLQEQEYVLDTLKFARWKQRVQPQQPTQQSRISRYYKDDMEALNKDFAENLDPKFVGKMNEHRRNLNIARNGGAQVSDGSISVPVTNSNSIKASSSNTYSSSSLASFSNLNSSRSSSSVTTQIAQVTTSRE